MLARAAGLCGFSTWTGGQERRVQSLQVCTAHCARRFLVLQQFLEWGAYGASDVRSALGHARTWPRSSARGRMAGPEATAGPCGWHQAAPRVSARGEPFLWQIAKAQPRVHEMKGAELVLGSPERYSLLVTVP